jgi:hypothetical protein
MLVVIATMAIVIVIVIVVASSAFSVRCTLLIVPIVMQEIGFNPIAIALALTTVAELQILPITAIALVIVQIRKTSCCLINMEHI